jgi:hypothetical protein
MISVYGQRATMVSFSALLAISLAFAHLQTGWDRIQYSGLILFRFILPHCFFNFLYIRPNRYAELQIAECIKLTSKYLQLRGDLWELESDRKQSLKQLNLVQLNTIHENIREILIRNRTTSARLIKIENYRIYFISRNYGL